MVTKRQDVYPDFNASYYTTFQKQSGERIEFRLSGKEYGMLVEGDRGILRFQGTRYLGFKKF